MQKLDLQVHAESHSEAESRDSEQLGSKQMHLRMVAQAAGIAAEAAAALCIPYYSFEGSWAAAQVLVATKADTAGETGPQFDLVLKRMAQADSAGLTAFPEKFGDRSKPQQGRSVETIWVPV